MKSTQLPPLAIVSDDSVATIDGAFMLPSYGAAAGFGPNRGHWPIQSESSLAA